MESCVQHLEGNLKKKEFIHTSPSSQMQSRTYVSDFPRKTTGGATAAKMQNAM